MAPLSNRVKDLLSFFEFVSSGAVVPVQGRDDFAGRAREMDDQVLDFPTETRVVTVHSPPVAIGNGSHYRVAFQGGYITLPKKTIDRKLNGRKPRKGDRYEITWYVYRRENKPDHDFKSIRLVSSAGAPLPTSTATAKTPPQPGTS